MQNSRRWLNAAQCIVVLVVKDGSTVRSEFAYYVPRTLNRTVPVPLQKRRTVPTYHYKNSVPYQRTVPYCHPYLWYMKQRLTRQAWENFSQKKTKTKKRSILCQKVAKRVWVSKNLRVIKKCKLQLMMCVRLNKVFFVIIANCSNKPRKSLFNFVKHCCATTNLWINALTKGDVFYETMYFHMYCNTVFEGGISHDLVKNKLLPNVV